MLAAQVVRQPHSQPRVPNVRTARGATQRRVSRTSRMRYAQLVRFCATLAVVMLLVMTYVMLTSRLTGLNYAVAKAEHQRTVLQSQTARLDDELSILSSDDRLARLAAKLHMQAPEQFAVVTLPAPVHPEDHSHLAFLTTLKTIFHY